MNRHTFKDVGKRSALSNELDDDEEDHDGDVKELKRAVEGEEDESESKFNEAGDVIEAFNLADEREGGHFDENMNYVFKKEKGEVDAWVAEMDEVAMEQAIGEAQRAVKRKAAEREEEERREAAKEFKTSIQLKKELLTLMQPRETVASTMRRLSGKAAKAPEKGAGIVRRRAPPTSASTTEEEKQPVTSAQQKLLDQKEARERRARVDRVTELSDELLTRGLTGVYNMSYESLRASTQTWEYQGQDGKLYGPYTAQQLAGWKAQGVFTSTWVRPVGENHASDNSTAGATASVVSAASAVAPTDSMYDDDIYSTEPVAPVAPPAVAVVAEWVNSDEVDFGEYVNLDQAHQQLQQRTDQRKRQAMTSAQARAAAAAELRAERDIEGGALTRGATLGDDGREEEEDVEEEAEGLSYRKKKNTGRRTQDIPDDSDEDN